MTGIRMAAEMAEQPAVLRRLVARRDQLRAELDALRATAFAGVSLIARGSSANVAVHARYVLEMATGRPVGLAAPSLQTLYRTPVDYRDRLVIAVSQSGATPEIVETLGRLAEAGARTVAVTNEQDSDLARAADLVVALDAGPEVAVPATKTVTAQFVALALIARALARPANRAPFSDDELRHLPDAVETVLADDDRVPGFARVLADADSVVTVARGLLYPAALETALKVRESAGIIAEGWSAADLRHGPIAALRSDRTAVIGFFVRGPAGADTEALLTELGDRGLRALRVGEAADVDLQLPPVGEALAVVPAVVRGQQLAHATALRRGIDPDAPFGLSKVTAT